MVISAGSLRLLGFRFPLPPFSDTRLISKSGCERSSYPSNTVTRAAQVLDGFDLPQYDSFNVVDFQSFSGVEVSAIELVADIFSEVDTINIINTAIWHFEGKTLKNNNSQNIT